MLLGELREEMATASSERHFEEAARLRDEIATLESLDDRGELETHVQPEVFPIDPKRGLAGLQKVLHLTAAAADDRGHRHRPLGRHRHRGLAGAIYRRAALQAGLPADENPDASRAPTTWPASTRRFSRRFQHIQQESETPPDILLVDGGKGQLNAALAALDSLGIDARGATGTAGQASSGTRKPVLISLAKREELVFMPDADEPLHLSRHSYALRLLQYVRDEAHRFAQHYHHLLRKKSQLGE